MAAANARPRASANLNIDDLRQIFSGTSFQICARDCVNER
jgi:hypothetical protein